MKLEGIDGGSVLVTAGRHVGRVGPRSGYEPLGTIPRPPSARAAILRSWPVDRLLATVVGRFPTTNCWRLAPGVLLATHGRFVWRSGDDGASWTHVHTLPPDSGPMGVLPTSVCVHAGETYLAEYPLGDGPARILRSPNDGRTWHPYLVTDRHRHFHGVFADPYDGELWATAGDADEECAIGRLRNGRFEPVGGGAQRWRAVDLAFTRDAIVWGMDCAYADRVSVFRLDRAALDGGDPVAVHEVDASVYYLATIEDEGETWIAAATQAEVGTDRTAGAETGRADARTARVWVASDRTNLRTWRVAASYRRTPVPADRIDRLPAANGYVYLAGDPQLGLVINPFSVGAERGGLHRVPPTRLRSMAVDETGRPTVDPLPATR